MNDRKRILNSLINSEANDASIIGLLIIMRSVADGNALRM